MSYEWRRAAGESKSEYVARIREALGIIVGIVQLEVGHSVDFDDLISEVDRIIEDGDLS